MTRCERCGVEFCGRSHHPQRFCSKSCAFTGQPRPSAVGNKWAFRGDRRSRAAFYYEARQLFPLDRPCEMCGGAPELIHHVDEDPSNNVESNVKRLCRKCHINLHREALRA